MNSFYHFSAEVALAIYHYFYPLRCIICEKEISSAESLRICSSCLKNIPPSSVSNKSDRCIICSRKLISESVTCTRCREEDYNFEKNISVWNYSNETVKTLIHNYKFKNYPDASFFLSGIFKEIYLSCFPGFAVVPVPCSRGRLKKFGWDHMDRISELLKRSSIPVFRILRKNSGREQKTLNSKQRHEAVKNKFILKKNFSPDELKSFPGILIIDDIFTTGSTVNQCTSVLKDAGIINIHILTLALD